jgi:hypothetical protein
MTGDLQEMIDEGVTTEEVVMTVVDVMTEEVEMTVVDVITIVTVVTTMIGIVLSAITQISLSVQNATAVENPKVEAAEDVDVTTEEAEMTDVDVMTDVAEIPAVVKTGCVEIAAISTMQVEMNAIVVRNPRVNVILSRQNVVKGEMIVADVTITAVEMTAEVEMIIVTKVISPTMIGIVLSAITQISLSVQNATAVENPKAEVAEDVDVTITAVEMTEEVAMTDVGVTTAEVEMTDVDVTTAENLRKELGIGIVLNAERTTSQAETNASVAVPPSA